MLRTRAVLTVAGLALCGASPAPTPPLGWQNWNFFRNNFNASLYDEIADFLAASGLRDAGYTLLSLGGMGYTTGGMGGETIARNATGYYQVDTTRFPGGNAGMSALAQRLRGKGFKFGAYTNAGKTACDGAKGTSQGYEQQDAALFFGEWGASYVMVDNCGIVPEEGRSGDEQSRYELTLWRQLINATGRDDIILHNCHNGCISTFNGPTLVAAPCDAAASAQRWLMSVDGSYSQLANAETNLCAGCGGLPAGGCGGSVTHGIENLKHGLGMQACVGCREVWNGTGPYNCNARGLGEQQQVYNYSAGLLRQKQYGSALSVARAGAGPEIVTYGGPFEPAIDSSSLWDAVDPGARGVMFRSRLNASLCLAQGAPVAPSLDPWCAENNNMWRSNTDTLQVWTRVMTEVESMAGQGGISRPDAWSFPDCMEVGVPGLGVLTWQETKSHIALYAVTSAPLFLGNDPRPGRMQQRLVDLLLNPAMLEVNQNYTLGFAGGRLQARAGGVELWAKPLEGGRAGVVLFNRGGYVPCCNIDMGRPDLAPCDDDTSASWGAQNITLDFARDVPRAWLSAVGTGALACDVTDIYATPRVPTPLGRLSGSYTASVPPHGVAFLIVSGCSPAQQAA